MLPAYITHADCALHEMGPHHPECPERLGAINDMLLIKGLLDYMNPYDAPLATLEQLAHAHASRYVPRADGCIAHRGLPQRRPRHRHEPPHRTRRPARRRCGGAGHRPGAGGRSAHRVLLRAPARPPRRARALPWGSASSTTWPWAYAMR